MEYFNVKHKINKWTSNPPLVACGNGTVFSEDFYNSDYGCAFTNFSRESCYHCKFKGNEKKGDLSIGDFWGIENLHIKYNKLGVSAIISRTKRGEELCHYLATRGVMRECSLQSIVSSNPWVNSSISKSKYYIKYKHNLPKSSKLYMPVRFRLKTVLKKVVTWSRKH